MKKFFVFLLLGYFTSFVLQAQNQVCGNVLDPSGNCPGFSGVNIVIKDVNGNVVCSGLQTGTDGSFCCEVDPSLYPITICAEVNCTNTIQLSTLDLAIIQQFILGVPGNYPAYFFYLADINGDGYVNSVDLVELRKVILGTKTAPNPEFPELCRIINEDCLFLYGSDPGAWNLCIGLNNHCTVINSAFGIGDPINFYLFNVGDADQNSMGCTKPLRDDIILSSRNQTLEFKYNILHDGLELRLASEIELNMLVLSFSIGDITIEDIEIFDERLDYSLEDGDLHISYFSDRPDDKIIIKNLVRLKSKRFKNDVKFERGSLIDANGRLYDLSISGMNAETIEDKTVGSFDTIEGQILQIIKQDGSIIDVQKNHLFTNELFRLQENFNLTSGIYFLKIKNEITGQTGNRKLVVFN